MHIRLVGITVVTLFRTAGKWKPHLSNHTAATLRIHIDCIQSPNTAYSITMGLRELKPTCASLGYHLNCSSHNWRARPGGTHIIPPIRFKKWYVEGLVVNWVFSSLWVTRQVLLKILGNDFWINPILRSMAQTVKSLGNSSSLLLHWPLIWCYIRRNYLISPSQEKERWYPHHRSKDGGKLALWECTWSEWE